MSRGQEVLYALIGVPILVLGVWVASVTSPASIWLAGAFALGYILHLWKLWAEQTDRRQSMPAVFGRIFGPELRDTVLACAAGLILVVLVQLCLTLGARFVSEDSVWVWERRLVLLRTWLSATLGIKRLVVIFIVLLTATLVFPRLRLVSWFNDHRKLLSRFVTALTAATSFTFFSTGDIAIHDQKWAAQHREDIEQQVRRIDHARRHLAAAAWVQKQLESSSPENRRGLANLLNDLSKHRGQRVLAQIASEQMVTSARPLSDVTESNIEDSQKESMFEGLLDDVRIWQKRGDSSGYRPSLGDLRQCTSYAERLDAALREAQSAVNATLGGIINSFLPSSLPETTKIFCESLTGALVKKSLEAVYPRGVRDLATAALWLKLAISTAMLPLQEPDSAVPWELNVGTVQIEELADRFSKREQIDPARPNGDGKLDDKKGRRVEPGRAIER